MVISSKSVQSAYQFHNLNIMLLQRLFRKGHPGQILIRFSPYLFFRPQPDHFKEI